MFCMELITLFTTLCALEAMGVTVDSRYIYPISMEDVSDHLPSTPRKTLSQRYRKFRTTPGPDSSEYKYLILLKPSGSSEADAGISDNYEEDIEFQPKRPLKNLPYLRKPTEPFLSERPRFRSQPIKSVVIPQSEGDNRFEFRLPKKLRALVVKEPILEADDDTNEGRIAYQVNGRKAYKFGYDTGKGRHHHSHDEEGNSNGHVKGRYGFINPKVRPTIVKYTSSPERDFRIDS